MPVPQRRRVATCESQQGTEQNTRRVRLRLQVETLQTQWTAPNAMPFLQALQSIQMSAAISAIQRIVRLAGRPRAGFFRSAQGKVLLGATIRITSGYSGCLGIATSGFSPWRSSMAKRHVPRS